MGMSANGTASLLDALSQDLEPVPESKDSHEAGLLLEAFQMFTQASSSLETAFHQLQARTRRLSEELAAKNRELKKSLREKKEVQNYLERILECLPCGVLVFDESGRVTLCNPVAARVLDQSASAKPKGNKPARWNAAVRKYLAAFEDRENGGSDVEIPFVSGNSLRILATASTPLRSASGAKVGALHIIRDITEMKSMEAQSKRSERLTAMGEMAVELAHEIRNPLGSIELFASLLEKELPRQSDPGRWAENIRVGSHSLNNIVSNMLQFANPLAPQFREVDLHDLVNEILNFADPILKQREVRVETRLDAQEKTVIGDAELLKQMILNLLLNSLQAMPSHGSVRVGTRDVQLLPGGACGAGVELTVQDTGLGIPPENLGRVFDPFFTTNKNGTGLGLSVVHQIVEQHSGLIHVDSKVGAGTTFTINLPGAHLVSGAA
jgi:signal transduction histidine kinase